jgi:hypothetical protein
LVRSLTSWKLWTALLVLAVIGIGVSLTMPIVHRNRAMRYFDTRGAGANGAGYSLRNEQSDWPERYGEWAKGLRGVDNVHDSAATDESLRHVCALNDMELLILWESKTHPFTDPPRGNLPGFPRLELVQFFGQGFTDEFLAEFLSGAPKLNHIMLGRTSAGSETMAAIARLPSVAELTISMNDDVFFDLPPMPNLREFYVADAGDACAAWLASCPVIERVSFSDSSLTDAGLQRLTAAKGITLSDTRVTDAGLQHLASFPSLEKLGMQNCPEITAVGLSQLPDLPYLHELWLPPEFLTRESISRLRQLPKLSDVYVVFERIPDPEIRRLAEAEWEVHEP